MDRRRHVRHEVQLPVELDWGTGVTHDMSVSGAYIEAPRFDLPVGESFDFSVTIGKVETGSWTLRCHGMVIRIEKRGDRIGIAASIDRFVEISSFDGHDETSH
jgi:hypothetical protein